MDKGPFYNARELWNINTLNKVQKILPFFGMSENSDQSFNMVVYENFFFRFLKCPEVTISCSFKY